MKAAALAPLLILSACTTIKDTREVAPKAVYSSQRSEAALEHCLSGELSWTGTPAVIRGEGSTEIAFDSQYGTDLLITLRPIGTGTSVEVREQHGYVSKVRRGVEGCVTGTIS